MWIKPDEEDVNLIHCYGNPLPEEAMASLRDYLSMEVGTIYETLEKIGEDISVAISGSIVPGLKIGILAGVLRLKDRAILFLGSSAGGEEIFNTACLGFCGLVHVVFKLMQPSYPCLANTVPPIEMGDVVDKTTNTAIAKRVASWFTSGRNSVELWKASL